MNDIVTVIAVLTFSCDANAITQRPNKNTFVATENP